MTCNWAVWSNVGLPWLCCWSPATLWALLQLVGFSHNSPFLYAVASCVAKTFGKADLAILVHASHAFCPLGLRAASAGAQQWHLLEFSPFPGNAFLVCLGETKVKWRKWRKNSVLWLIIRIQGVWVYPGSLGTCFSTFKPTACLSPWLQI